MVEPLAAGEGERTHPLGLIIAFISGLPQLIFPVAALLFGTARSTKGTPYTLYIIAIVLGISLLLRWIAWMRFRFHLDDDDIRIEQGLINRTVRSIPYDRIQDVSIEQKLLAQMFNVGEVKFETGGGEGEDAKLSFVRMERAQELRATIRARKADGVRAAETSETDFLQAVQPIFAMDSNRLFTLGLYSFSLVIFALLGGAAQQFDFLLPFDFWDFKHWAGIAEKRGVSIDGISNSTRIFGAMFVLLSLIILGFASGIIRTILKEYGFRLDRTERGFRRRRGLLTKTDVVMPVNRVQAAVIITGPIRKRRGWHALKFVSLAQDSKEESDFIAAPLAKLPEIWPIAAQTAINPPDENLQFRTTRFAWWATELIGPLACIVVAIVSVIIFADVPFATAGWLLFVPVLFLVLAWVQWRRYSDLFDRQQLYVRKGWWRQTLTIAPQVKIQSAEISQGLIARMFGLSTLHFGIAGGTLSFSALPLAEARAIRDHVMTVVAPVDFQHVV